MKAFTVTRALGSLSLFVTSAATFAAPTYEIVSIGNLPGYTGGWAAAINNSNQVVGTSTVLTQKSGFLWSEEAGMDDINILGYESVQANGLNDNGSIVGYFSNEGKTKGFRAKINGLGGGIFHFHFPQGSDTVSATFGINNLENCVGQSSAIGRLSAVGWTTLSPLPFAFTGFDPEEGAVAVSINDSNDSAGYVTVNGVKRATIFRNNGTNLDLHAMLPGAVSSTAQEINELGWVSGYFHDSAAIKSFIFNPEVGMSTVNPFLSTGRLEFSAISDTGIAVGTQYESRPTAAIWSSDKGLRDLNNLIDSNSGWTLKYAYGVNNAGYVCGRGVFNGVESNWLAKPLPASVAGTITLGDYIGSAPGSSVVPITFKVMNLANTILQTKKLFIPTTNGVGNYSLTLNLGVEGPIKIAVSGPTFLQKTFETTPQTTGNDVLLINGNCFQDGVVDLSDYTTVVTAFNAIEDEDPIAAGNQSSPNWQVEADLNRDGVVDLTDYTVVAMNFNQVDN